MKKIALCLSFLMLVFCVSPKAWAEEPASFGFFNFANYYNYVYWVGDEVDIYFYVEANGHNNLNVVNATVKISDPTVLEPILATDYFTPGNIYSQLGFQKYESPLMNVLVYVDPNNKPTERSGYIGSFKFKALKTGSATLSVEKLEVTEEGNEDSFVETTSTNIDIAIESAGSSDHYTASAGASAAASASATSTTAASNTGSKKSTSSTVKGTQTSNISDVSTGPEAIIALCLAVGGAIYFLIRKMKVRKL